MLSSMIIATKKIEDTFLQFHTTELSTVYFNKRYRIHTLYIDERNLHQKIILLS